ncbi:acylneuraminate cytidylyltransferase family protein [Pelagibacteraceae bacterium]|nr:acylneuraminate cytidylyltransferase family protein [Pelagibacteraceae bacterium]
MKITKKNSNIVAFIPAKTNSIRLPNKNFKNFNGKPLVYWTILEAKKSKLFRSIIVSTDNKKFENICSKLKVDFHNRETKFMKPKSSVLSLCTDFLENEIRNGNNIDILCILYATAPLRKSSDIINTYNLISETCHFSMAVSKYNLPYNQALNIKNNRIECIWKNEIFNNNSKLNNAFVDNGSTYFVNVKSFLREKTFYGKSLKTYEMPWHKSIDINNHYDFKLVKKLFK